MNSKKDDNGSTQEVKIKIENKKRNGQQTMNSHPPRPQKEQSQNTSLNRIVKEQGIPHNEHKRKLVVMKAYRPQTTKCSIIGDSPKQTLFKLNSNRCVSKIKMETCTPHMIDKTTIKKLNLTKVQSVDSFSFVNPPISDRIEVVNHIQNRRFSRKQLKTSAIDPKSPIKIPAQKIKFVRKSNLQRQQSEINLQTNAVSSLYYQCNTSREPTREPMLITSQLSQGKVKILKGSSRYKANIFSNSRNLHTLNEDMSQTLSRNQSLKESLTDFYGTKDSLIVPNNYVSPVPPNANQRNAFIRRCFSKPCLDIPESLTKEDQNDFFIKKSVAPTLAHPKISKDPFGLDFLDQEIENIGKKPETHFQAYSQSSENLNSESSIKSSLSKNNSRDSKDAISGGLVSAGGSSSNRDLSFNYSDTADQQEMSEIFKEFQKYKETLALNEPEMYYSVKTQLVKKQESMGTLVSLGTEATSTAAPNSDRKHPSFQLCL